MRDESRRPASWRLWAGVVIACALGAATAAAVVLAANDDVELVVGRPQAAVLAPESSAIPAAQDALDAWGRFATSADLGDIAGYFDPAGPQYAQLRDESRDLRSEGPGHPSYSFELLEPHEVTTGEEERVIRGVVVVTRVRASESRITGGTSGCGGPRRLNAGSCGRCRVERDASVAPC